MLFNSASACARLAARALRPHHPSRVAHQTVFRSAAVAARQFRTAAAATWCQQQGASPAQAQPSASPSRFTLEETYRLTRLPLDEATNLPPEVYYSQEFYQVEQQQVFGKSWVCVGYTQQLQRQGDAVVASVAGQPIFVIRTKKGDLNGFYNVCRHRGSQLLSKDGQYPVVLCPYHHWAYAPDGRLVATPQMDTKAKPCPDLAAAFDTGHVKNFDKKDYGLFPVRVETMGNLVFVCLDSATPPLKRLMGHASVQYSAYNTESLVRVRSKVYPKIKANWKLLMENFMEYYHLKAVHPALCAVSGVDEHVRMQGDGLHVSFGTKPLTQGGTPLDPGYLPHIPGLPEYNQDMALFHALWPNVFYFAMPSHVFAVYCTPQGSEQSEEHADLFVHPSVLELPDIEERLDAMWQFYDKVNMEDLEACERVQIGVNAAPYRGGRLVFKFEETIHRWANILIDHMVGTPRYPRGDDLHVPGTAWTDSLGYESLPQAADGA